MTAPTDPAEVTATDLAATALIGALLWNPRRAADVAWLEPEDFSHPAHRALYSTITGMLRDGHRVDARTVTAPLAAGQYHDFRALVRENPAGLIHTMLAGAPGSGGSAGMEEQPGARSEHVRYGQLVLDDSIRRQIAEAGIRIGQTSRAAISVDYEAAAEQIGTVLEQTIERLQSLVGRHQASAGRQPLATYLANPARREQADGDRRAGGASRRELDPVGIARAERRLLGACLTEAPARSIALKQLQPQDFSDRATAETWAVLAELDRAGGPVDHVFVAVELERRTAGGDRRGLAPAELSRLWSRALPGTAAGDLDTVARAALQRIGQAAQAELTAVAENRGRRSVETLAVAQDAVRTAENAAQRVGAGHSVLPGPERVALPTQKAAEHVVESGPRPRRLAAQRASAALTPPPGTDTTSVEPAAASHDRGVVAPQRPPAPEEARRAR